MFEFLKRTIGQKFVIGLSGLALCGFILMHMLGNLFIFQGEKAYNFYAHNLHQISFLKVFEIGLFAVFLIHIVFSIFINKKNLSARKISYFKVGKKEKKTFFMDRILVFQGVTLVFFLIWHLLTFKFGTYYEISYDGVSMRNIYKLLVETFQKPIYVLGYCFALFILGFHLFHGFFASFKSLGFSHSKLTSFLKVISWIFSIGISLGFLSLPIYIYFIL